MNVELRKLVAQHPDKITQVVREDGIVKTVICEKVVIYTMITESKAMVHLVEPIAEITPEELATIQAMYSRSNKSMINRFIDLLFNENLEQTTSRIVGDVHKGYGHASIGDLGSFVLCYEGVSMLAAKAIQDTQLYDGQEASTRYITFDKQPFLYVNNQGSLNVSTTENTDVSSLLQESWRQFYLEAVPIVRDSLFHKYPWEDQKSILGEDGESDYKRAINARAFDIIRGFLPAGCSTNLAWYTSIRHCADHVAWMRCHPLREIRSIAHVTQQLVEVVYPTSFQGRGFYQNREDYKTDFMQTQYYLENLLSRDIAAHYSDVLLDKALLVKNWKNVVLNRPQGQEMHYSIGETGTVKYDALLDFASFRDQQRHRAVVQRQGLVSDQYGFHDWYLDNLPDAVREKAENLLVDNLKTIKELMKNGNLDKFEAQYLYPMGMKIPTTIVGHIGKVLYMVELRAQTSVHPTYHENAYDFAMCIKKTLAKTFSVPDEVIPLYVDSAVGQFSIKRGSQTIFFKGKAISDEE